MAAQAEIFDEPPWAGFYHALVLEGKAEVLVRSRQESSWLVAIREEDRLEFPSLPHQGRFIFVLASRKGFIWTRVLTKVEADLERKL